VNGPAKQLLSKKANLDPEWTRYFLKAALSDTYHRIVLSKANKYRIANIDAIPETDKWVVYYYRKNSIHQDRIVKEKARLKKALANERDEKMRAILKAKYAHILTVEDLNRELSEAIKIRVENENKWRRNPLGTREEHELETIAQQESMLKANLRTVAALKRYNLSD
jgi:hypothetical protein